MQTVTIITDERLPGYEIRKVGPLQYEIWQDGSHLGNYANEPFADSDSFACGFFAGMLSAKKD